MRLRNVLTFCFLCCGSNANSCRGSQRVFVASALVCVYIHNLHVCERTWPVLHLPAGAVLFPGCRCCCEITSCRLPVVCVFMGSSHFLSAGKRKL